MKRVIITLTLLIGLSSSAQTRSVFNEDNEIYNAISTVIWKVDYNEAEPTYYIKIKHPKFNKYEIHSFKLSQLKQIYCYSLDYMSGKEFKYNLTMYHAKLEHNLGDIHFKTGFNSKKKPYVKVEIQFYDSEWIHAFSEPIYFEQLLKWIGEDFKEWITPEWQINNCK